MDDGRAFDTVADSDGLTNAARWNGYVRGLTHKHYRYPARFSPEFARHVVSAFSEPGDLVFDPFIGGGTSAVEALAAGRRVIGTDTNQLAHFVSKAKTDVLDHRDETRLFSWILELSFSLRDAPATLSNDAFMARNVPHHIRKIIAASLDAIRQLPTTKQQRFARCSILRTAQWALDCKRSVPTGAEFRQRHQELFFDMLAGHQEFSDRVLQHFGSIAAANQACRLRCMDASRVKSNLDPDDRPTLLLTSPPYLGVHVLYHRWQVRGRKETEAPYVIADREPAQSSIPFTFSHRRTKSTKRYYDGVLRCFEAAFEVLRPGARVVQLVAFASPKEQLGLYLQMMDQAGFHYCGAEVAVTPPSPIARDVPNQKWYAKIINQSQASKEFLLVHRKPTN